MQATLRARFWVEGLLAALCAFLAILTWCWSDWIEAITGLSPDNHDGAFEWGLVAALCVLFLIAGRAARGEWARARTGRVAASS